jgi:predicted DNA-binding transcriptional regulator AlpA
MVKLLSTAMLQALLGNPHRETIRRWVRDGIVPQPMKMAGPRSKNAWLESEVLARLEERLAARPSLPAAETSPMVKLTQFPRTVATRWPSHLPAGNGRAKNPANRGRARGPQQRLSTASSR